MRYRIGIIRRDWDSNIEILYDGIENKSTVKKIINYGIKNQTSWEFIHGSYFAEFLGPEGVWINITDYWNYLAYEGLESALDNGKLNIEKFEKAMESARYGFSDEIDYILDKQGRFEAHYTN